MLLQSLFINETPVESADETPEDEHAKLEGFSLVLPPPNFPSSQTNASKPVPPTENPRSPALSTVIPDVSHEPSAEVSTPKRYLTRV